MIPIKRTELFTAMMACGRYEEQDAVDAIQTMRESVDDGDDPEELLNDEGFEPDYILDILDY